MAVYESILNILLYFEVLSHRSWSSVYFKKCLVGRQEQWKIWMLCIPGIVVLPSSEGGWEEKKTSVATAAFVVLGSSLLLGETYSSCEGQ